MRWPVFAIAAAVALAAELSIVNVLALHLAGGVRPSVMICLATFIALCAPKHAALWSCWLLGLLVDLATDLPQGTGAVVHLIGPHALGYLLAGWIILQVRPMVFRRHVLTIAVMTIIGSLAASLVVVAIFAVRRWYPAEALNWTDFRAAGELLRRLGVALYSGILSVAVGWILLSTSGIWGFQATTSRMGTWR